MKRHGFTLIEVLIALGLTVVLFAAVFSALDLYRQYQTAGRAEIRGLQLHRSLVSRIEEDLNSIVMQPSEDFGLVEESPSTAPPEQWSESTSQGASESASELELAGLADTGPPLQFGLIGDAELLHLTVNRPSRQLVYSVVNTPESLEARTSDLSIVTYGLAPIDTETMRRLQEKTSAVHPATGLGRRMYDFYSLAGTPLTLDSPDLLAPEVTEVMFRYFDGVEWYESWDSRLTGALPRAIEIQFGYWNPPATDEETRSRRDDGTVTTVGHLFYLPLSVPSGLEVTP